MLLDIAALQTTKNKLTLESVDNLKNFRVNASLPDNEMNTAKYNVNI